MSELPLHRLSEFIELRPDDVALLLELCGPVRSLDRQSIVQHQGGPPLMHMLLEGWAIACVDLPGGQRQIVKIHLPGDMLGSPNMVLEAAAATIIAMTPVLVSALPLPAMARILRDAPRLAATIMLSIQ